MIEPLRVLIAEYAALTLELDWNPTAEGPRAAPAEGLPVFEGFHTIERIGAGGMGEVFKLRDLRLDRIVAAKVLRPDAALPAGVGAFLGEARSLALFSDRRIVRLLEFRPETNPPVLIMEHVEGFELGRIGPSLEFRQRARVLHEVCLAIGHAHALGIQHRDLKPSNIMVDAQLVPRILDFGLSGGDPKAGHLKGTLQYVAPEQLEPSQPIDERTDVYALGVILYELLCGRPPYTGSSGDILAGIRARPAAPADRALAGCSGRAAGDRAQGDGARSAAPLSIGAGDGRRPRTVSSTGVRCSRGRPSTRRPSATGRQRTSPTSTSGCACG